MPSSPSLTSLLSLASLTLFPVAAKAKGFPSSGTAWVTPHDSYSSSIGVLGCKVNTNRIAYWPPSPDCTNLCITLSYGSRSVNLLRVDQSGGAYDVSYDAWNYLYTGNSAEDAPVAGGAVEMTYEEVDMSQCEDLINTDGHKLPLSAANSMNFLTSCLEQPSSWVASNYVLYNILDPICTMGRDEVCTLQKGMNQPTCPHTLGEVGTLDGDTVWNIAYPSGKKWKAGTTPPPPPDGAVAVGTGDTGDSGAVSGREALSLLVGVGVMLLWL